MWGLLFLTASSTGALLSGNGACGLAAKHWNRYAPESQLNGIFSCQSKTALGAVEELAGALLPAAANFNSCDAVVELVNTLDPGVAVNFCNATNTCANQFTCIAPTGECGYCAPSVRKPSREPCFSGGVIECKSLIYNGIAAGSGLFLSVLL